MNSPAEIRWDLIASAREWYSRCGYHYVEAPWIVTEEAIKATLPPGKFGYSLGHPNYSPGFLVGSAEQSFLQMILEDRLPAGKYFAMGPCFRDDEVDELHSKSFFKVELIEVIKDKQSFGDVDDDSIYSLMMTCKRFFEDFCGHPLTVVPTSQTSYDLELAGIEVGSYGLRRYAGHKWIYGTGLALPRLNIAAAKCGTPIRDRK